MRNRIVISLPLMAVLMGIAPVSLFAETPQVLLAHYSPLSKAPESREKSIEDLIVEGDTYYDTREDAGHADQAIRLYRQVIAQDPENHEAFWRLARSYKWKGDVARSIQERVEAYQSAERCAKKSVALKPEAVNGHLMLGISYGLVGATEGGFKAARLISLLKKEMNIVLEKDPKNEIAHLVYGVLYRVLPGILGGSNNKSIKSLKKAIQSNPHRTTHYLELAKSYLEKGKKSAAKKSLRGLLAIDRPTDRVQARSDRNDANALLKEIG